MHPLTNAETETIKKEVGDRFNQLVDAVNRKDAHGWSEHYSKDGFLSAIAGVDCYTGRSAWVEKITSYFSGREYQHMEPSQVQIAPLASGMALMTSRESAEMGLKNGQRVKSIHVFSMVWKKEQNGWKIVHSHESWIDEV